MTPPAGRQASRLEPAAACALAAMLVALWFALSGGEDWIFGSFAVLSAVALSQRLAPLPRIGLSIPGRASPIPLPYRNRLP